MKTLDLAKAVQLTCGCQSTASFLDPKKITWIESQDEKMSPRLRETLVEHYGQVSEFCTAFDLPISEASSAEVIKLLESEDTSTGSWLHSPTRELVKRIQAELKSRLFLYVPNQNAIFYQESSKGWTKTQDAFSGAMHEVEEAAKCLALRRSTACVFHLMRILELGLRELATVFNIPFAHKAWNEIIEQIEAAIRKIREGKNKPPDWKDSEQFYSEAASQFMHFRAAWRNYTAHGSLRYAEDEAEAIFRHVRDFMEHISNRLREKPVP